MQHAYLWGYVFVLVFMTIESSFIPFPSEVVMVPAGFLAYRGEMLFSSPVADLLLVIFVGTLGAVIGAYINYFLFLKLGRPFLYRYGKFFFLSPPTIARAEEIFNKHGEMATFVCRLLPGIRQLISIPAGLAQMALFRFTVFTSLGAGIWSAVLALTGYYLASLTEGMTYAELVLSGKEGIREHFLWLLLGLSILIMIYMSIQRKIMKSTA